MKRKKQIVTGTLSCKLCGTVAKLCKSHIVPEFAYQSLYDSQHRFIEVTDVKKGRVRKAQKGYWEHLLCPLCEARINEFEKHSCHFFSEPLPPHILKSNRVRKFPNVSGEKLKLLLLSILWRASVSSLPTYRHVRLGPHESKIKEMILRQEAGSPEDYAVLICPLHLDGEHLKDFTVEPTHQQFSGRRCYRFVFSGFLFYIFVCSHGPPEGVKPRLLSSLSPVYGIDLELREIRFLRDSWNLVGLTTRDSNVTLQ